MDRKVLHFDPNEVPIFSPLLANILLDELDDKLEERGHKFVNYWKQWVSIRYPDGPKKKSG